MTTPAPGEALLKWQDFSNNEENFLVERKLANGAWTKLTSLPPDTTSYTDKKIQPEASLTYRISAVNKIGSSAPSPEQQIATLPDGILLADVGAPQISGQAFYDPARHTYTVKAGGAEVWGHADQFYLVAREMKGDVTVTAHVSDFSGGEYYAKAGVMIRSSQAVDATHAYMSVGPGSLAYFSNRRQAGGDSAQDQGLDSGPLKKWVRLVRSGKMVRGYFATTEKPVEKDWIALGQPTSIELTEPVLVGLAVASQSDVKTGTAVFDGFAIESRAIGAIPPESVPAQAAAQVQKAASAPAAIATVSAAPMIRSITGVLPTGWTSYDINNPALPGKASYDGEQKMFSVTGSGSDIWGVADSFQFTCRDESGSVEFMAKVPFTEEAGAFSKAGLMIRASLDANAAFAYILIKPDRQVNFTWRTVAGGPVEQSGWIGDIEDKSIRWLKLTRIINAYEAAVSVDGSDWIPVGEPAICDGIPEKAKIGFAVCSTSLTVVKTAQFSEVTVSGGDTTFTKPSAVSKKK